MAVGNGDRGKHRRWWRPRPLRIWGSGSESNPRPRKVITDVDGIVDVLGKLFDEGKKDDLLDAMRTVLNAAQGDMRAMSLRIAELIKRVYGRSTERIDPDQLRLTLEELLQEKASGASEATSEEVETTADLPNEVPESPPKSGSPDILVNQEPMGTAA